MTAATARPLIHVNALTGFHVDNGERDPCDHPFGGDQHMCFDREVDMRQAKWTAEFFLLLASAFPSAASSNDADPVFECTDGQRVSLADYRGQVVVLNLWAIWCGPCIVEIPELVELQRRIEAHGATVIGLAADSGSADQILGFWERRLDLEPSYPLWLTSMEQARTHFSASTIPLTLLIDREGVVRDRLLGAHDAETLMERLQPLL